MLLDKGADLSARRRYDSALQATSYRGHEEVVQIPNDLAAALNEHFEKVWQPFKNYGSRFPMVGPASTNGLDQLR